MAISVFSYTSSNVIQYGYLVGPSLVGGHNSYQWAGNQSPIIGTFTGTQLEWFGYANNASDFQFSVDGGAYSTPTLTTGAWGYQVLVTGLSDANHTFTLRNATAKLPYIDTDTSFRVTGASPAMPAPVSYGTQKVITNGAVSPYVLREGGLSAITAGGYATAVNVAWADASLTFRATADTIGLWMYCDGGKVTLAQDYVDIATITPANTSTWEFVSLSATRDNTTEHVYTVTNDSSLWYAYAIITKGGTGLNQTTTLTARNLWAFYGDSITAGTAGTGTNTSLALPHRIANLQKISVANRGIGSSTDHHFASGGNPVTTQAGETRTADITGLSASAIKRVAVLYGTNDMGQVGGVETVAQFQASYIATLNALITGLPANTPIDCLSILPRTDFTPNTISTWNAGIIAAVAGCSIPAQCTYRDTSTWICVSVGGASNYTDPNGDMFDSTHPNSAGYTKIAAKYNAFFTLVILPNELRSSNPLQPLTGVS